MLQAPVTTYAAVLAAVTNDTRELIYRDEIMARVVKLAQQIAGALVDAPGLRSRVDRNRRAIRLSKYR